MKPNYRLQAVLTIRKRQERAALESYARALEHVRQAAAQVATAEARTAAVCAERRVLLARGGNAAELQQSHQFTQAVEESRRKAAGTLTSAERVAQGARQEVLHRRRRREVVEKHLQKQRRRFQLNAERFEQVVLDELGQLRKSVFGGTPFSEAAL